MPGRVTVIGCGLGPATLTMEGRQRISEADVLFGSPRLIEAFGVPGKPCLELYQSEQIAVWLERNPVRQAVLLVSGDVGFYSAAASFVPPPGWQVERIAGISTVNAFFALCGKPWQEAALISLHGRDRSLIEPVRRNRLTFVLGGGDLRRPAAELAATGFAACPVWLGENLGSPDQSVVQMTLGDLAALARPTESLAVLLIEHPDADTRVRCGIPDDAFTRGELPMTKAEIRAVALAHLAPAETDICWDIGCGTGSVTVELALHCHKGTVWALDHDPRAIALTGENCRRFQIGNVRRIEGAAPQALEELPPPQAVFIGGSSGQCEAIVAAIRRKNPQARICLAAIALETLEQGRQALTEADGRAPRVAQISVARSRPTGRLNLLMAQNPVFLLMADGQAGEVTC